MGTPQAWLPRGNRAQQSHGLRPGRARCCTRAVGTARGSRTRHPLPSPGFIRGGISCPSTLSLNPLRSEGCPTTTSLHRRNKGLGMSQVPYLGPQAQLPRVMI